jgi:hypothetical protein
VVVVVVQETERKLRNSTPTRAKQLSTTKGKVREKMTHGITFQRSISLILNVVVERQPKGLIRMILCKFQPSRIA